VRIYLLPVGRVEDAALEAIKECVTIMFDFEVRLLPPLPEPSYAFDPARKQYSSTLILRKAVENLPADTVKALAITEKDIFIPMLTFVYGQAQLDGVGALIGLARLRQEFLGLKPNSMLFFARALKEALHELGHTFGLTHCLNRQCIMSLSTNIRQVDAKGGEFCERCLPMLRDSITAVRQSIGNHHSTEKDK